MSTQWRIIPWKSRVNLRDNVSSILVLDTDRHLPLWRLESYINGAWDSGLVLELFSLKMVRRRKLIHYLVEKNLTLSRLQTVMCTRGVRDSFRRKCWDTKIRRHKNFQPRLRACHHLMYVLLV